MTIQAILADKGREVATIGPDERVSELVTTNAATVVGAWALCESIASECPCGTCGR